MCGLSDLFPIPIGGSAQVLSAIACKTHSQSHPPPPWLQVASEHVANRSGHMIAFYLVTTICGYGAAEAGLSGGSADVLPRACELQGTCSLWCSEEKSIQVKSLCGYKGHKVGRGHPTW